jgi:hypothetical protein
MQLLGERGACDRERGAVGVIDGRDQEQHGHDEQPDARPPHVRCGHHCAHHAPP